LRVRELGSLLAAAPAEIERNREWYEPASGVGFAKR
jgi:hypothetical protein